MIFALKSAFSAAAALEHANLLPTLTDKRVSQNRLLVNAICSVGLYRPLIITKLTLADWIVKSIRNHNT